MVQPLLEIIAEYTGYKCTLIAGTALEEGDQESQVKMYVHPPMSLWCLLMLYFTVA